MPKPLTLLLFSLLLLTGCMNKIPAVAKYQDEATRKCLAAGHTKEQCKPLPYPSCDPLERTCRP